MEAGVALQTISFNKWTKLAIGSEDSLLSPFRGLYEEVEGTMPKITRWNILYTQLLKAKLNETSPKLMKNLPNVNALMIPGRLVLKQHLDYLTHNYL